MLRPLRATTADQAKFVDREAERKQILRALGSGQNAVVSGPRGSGLTSLLAHVEHRSRGRWVVLSGEAAATPAELLTAVLVRLAGPAQLTEIAALRDSAERTGGVGLALTALLLERLDELTAERPVVVAIDGVRPQVAHALFGLQRNDVWNISGVTWLLAAHSGDEGLVLAPPADAFWDVRVRLAPLDAEAAAVLLARHERKLPARTLRELVASGRAWPATLLLGRDRTPEGDDSPLGRLRRWLATRGAASAADRELLAELGVSRQRAAQLLARLEADGEVTAATARPDGARPRKLYTLRSDDS